MVLGVYWVYFQFLVWCFVRLQFRVGQLGRVWFWVEVRFYFFLVMCRVVQLEIFIVDKKWGFRLVLLLVFLFSFGFWERVDELLGVGVFRRWKIRCSLVILQGRVSLDDWIIRVGFFCVVFKFFGFVFRFGLEEGRVGWFLFCVLV